MASRVTTDSERGSSGYNDSVDDSSAVEGWLTGGKVGPYHLLRVAGRGGAGTVYEAFHVALQRRVAIKVLRDEQLADAEAVARFEREIAVIGQLDHPHIVRAYDAGMVDGTAYLIMEYVDGLDGRALINRQNELPIPDACEIVRQAAEALHYAFQRGIVHRDIKPSNILLTRTGQVKVSDLGLVRLLAPSDEDDLTMEGHVFGTVDYLSPEQARSANRVDIRSDLYGLGCTLFHLLCGRPPFGDADHDSPVKKLTAHVQEPPPPIDSVRPQIPAELAAVVKRLLRKRPEDRYATPADLVAALSPFCVGCNLPELFTGEPDLLPDLRMADVSPRGSPKLVPLDETIIHPRSNSEAASGDSKPRLRRIASVAAAALLICAGIAAGSYHFFNSSDTEGASHGPRQERISGNVPRRSSNKKVSNDATGLVLLPGEDNDYGPFVLSGNAPAQIVWPGDHRGKPSWLFSEKNDRLDVTSKEVLLLRLGERLFLPKGGAQPEVISVEIEQPVWHGQTGLFFGYREEEIDGEPTAVMQLFRLMTGLGRDGKQEWRLYRYLALLPPQSGTINRLAATVWSPIDAPHSRSLNRLEFFFGKGRLDDVRWNGKPLPRLTSPEAEAKFRTEDFAGLWGIYNQGTTTCFSNPKVHLRRDNDNGQ